MDFLSNPTVRRALVTALGLGVVALNKKFGLNLDTTEMATLGGIVVAYLLQSGANSAIQGAKAAGDKAAAEATPEAIQQALADAVAKAQAKP